MSKMKELSQVLDEMIACGENMIRAANALKQTLSPSEEGTELPPEEQPVRAYAFSDVRHAFLAKSHEGYTEQVKALISKYGAAKLSDIRPEDYANLMADLEAIDHAD